jgi:CheY-like chemotaxis protein/HPt (histidine-containing phosphotransfer) domain-containing protein
MEPRVVGGGQNTLGKTNAVTFTATGAEVLIVDDLETNLKLNERLLSPYRVRVTTLTSGEEAVELVKTRHFDLVLMDRMMPVMDGVEALRRIRAAGPRFEKLPVVALTADAEEARGDLLEKGFDDFICKPVTRARLGEILKQWLPKEKQKEERQKEEKLEPREPALSLSPPEPEIEGVNVKRGIALTGGSVKEYLSVLALCFKDASNLMALLGKSLSDADLPLFTIRVHALKSLLANIGAVKLSQEAALLERAGEHGDAALIGSRLDAFHRDLAALLEQVAAILRRQKPEERVGSSLDRGALERLCTALESKDVRTADGLLAEMMSCASETEAEMEMKKTLEAISDSILMYEFEAAISLTRKLVEDVENRRQIPQA